MVYPINASALVDRSLHWPPNQVVACMSYKTAVHPSLSSLLSFEIDDGPAGNAVRGIHMLLIELELHPANYYLYFVHTSLSNGLCYWSTPEAKAIRDVMYSQLALNPCVQQLRPNCWLVKKEVARPLSTAHLWSHNLTPALKLETKLNVCLVDGAPTDVAWSTEWDIQPDVIFLRYDITTVEMGDCEAARQCLPMTHPCRGQ